MTRSPSEPDERNSRLCRSRLNGASSNSRSPEVSGPRGWRATDPGFTDAGMNAPSSRSAGAGSVFQAETEMACQRSAKASSEGRSPATEPADRAPTTESGP